MHRRSHTQHVGFAVREKVRDTGYDVLCANSPVFCYNDKIGEHDFVLGIGKPAGRVVSGRMSTEVRCRRVRDETHRRGLLDILTRECWKGTDDGKYFRSDFTRFISEGAGGNHHRTPNFNVELMRELTPISKNKIITPQH